MNILLIVLVFGVIVFFHELGHFIAAKANKITVNEFSIGMGPAIFSFKKKETKYSLRLLPIGGNCMMQGEMEDSTDPHAFNNQSVWVRMMVIFAGPFFNFVLAFLFSMIMLHYTGIDPATFYALQEGGPAQEAGIEPGDTVLKMDGNRIYNFREVQLFMAFYDSGEPIKMVMRKPDGTIYETEITPMHLDKISESSYILGVYSANVKAEGIGTIVKYSLLECRYWMKSTIFSLKMIFTGKVKSDQVMGPVGVGETMDDILDQVQEVSTTKKELILNYILNLLNWCILLSVNLGIMNLLPIPALDGGRLLFLIIEAVRRKRIPPEKEMIVNIIGFVLLMAIMVAVFFNDIKNVFF